MIRKITCTSTLVFYDGIQVFEGRDRIGGHYVGTLVGFDEAGNAQYAIVGASPSSVQKFRTGKIDLRRLIASRDGDEGWLFGTMTTEEDGTTPIVPAELRSDDVPDEYLPADGFFLSLVPEANPESVRRESVARNSIAVELAVDSSAMPDAHRLRADSLGGLLIHVQAVVRNAYRKSLSMAGTIRRIADREIGSVLDVAVPAAPGSLKIVLVPAQPPNLFGGGDVARGLEVLDYILANADDPDQTLERVRAYAGHTASAFVRLLRFMAEADLAIRYSWASPEREAVSVRTLTRRDVVPLLSRLSSAAKLTVESVELRGKLQKADIGRETWRLLSLDDGSEFSGECRDGVTLNGLVVGSSYVFHCEEESEEVPGTGRDVRRLYLLAYSSPVEDL